MAGIRDVDVPELFRLWNTSMTNIELCEHFQIAVGSLWSLRRRHGLPQRPRSARTDTHRRPSDPTPEQIAERAAWCRARRSSQDNARSEQAGRVGWELPAYAFDGRECSFKRVAH